AVDTGGGPGGSGRPRVPGVPGGPGMAGAPPRTPESPRPPLPAPRSVVLGLTRGGIERAYPLDLLRRQGAVLDDLGGTGVVILVAEDGNSLRAFESTLDGRRVPFFVQLDAAGTAAPRRWIG